MADCQTCETSGEDLELHEIRVAVRRSTAPGVVEWGEAKMMVCTVCYETYAGRAFSGEGAGYSTPHVLATVAACTNMLLTEFAKLHERLDEVEGLARVAVERRR